MSSGDYSSDGRWHTEAGLMEHDEHRLKNRWIRVLASFQQT